MKVLVLIFVLCSLSVGASVNSTVNSSGNSSVTSKLKSMKGWELYILEKGAEVQFALVEGSNRLKTITEISSKIKEISQIETALTALDKDEFVSLSNRFISLDNKIPKAQKLKLASICSQGKLNCFLGE